MPRVRVRRHGLTEMRGRWWIEVRRPGSRPAVASAVRRCCWNVVLDLYHKVNVRFFRKCLPMVENSRNSPILLARTPSRQQPFDHFTAHVGEPEVTALKAIGQPGMVKAE